MNMCAFLVFDIDGTLFRGDGAMVSAVWEAFDALGLRRPGAAEICSYFGRPIHEFHEWLRTLVPPEEAEGLLERIEKRELALVPERGRLFPGVTGALEACVRAGHRPAICSNGRKPYVSAVLEGMRIASFFSEIRARETVEENKTIMVRDLLARTSLRPAIVIGDRRDDVEAGRANGAHTIGCAYGFGTPGEIAGADAIVRSAAEIPAAVARLLARGEQEPAS
jgi:phosphoglycolate phosphatase-like HAD superfamily hydrolase